jgi:hypothetical protein
MQSRCATFTAAAERGAHAIAAARSGWGTWSANGRCPGNVSHRARTEAKRKLRVQHIATLDGWSDFEGVEGNGHFESDFFARVLLRRSEGTCHVESSWVLALDSDAAHTGFVRKLKAHVRDGGLDPRVLSPGIRETVNH